MASRNIAPGPREPPLGVASGTSVSVTQCVTERSDLVWSRGRTAGPAPVTMKRSNITCVNGAVPTTIIVASLVLAGYALLMTALNRRMNVPLLAAVGVLEILLLVQVGIIVARL